MKLIATCGAALCVAGIALVTRAPAQAALTGALTATTPTYSGNCPTTEAFTGTILGPAGTTFQYSFNRFINGVQQVQNVGAATMPASGTMTVNDSFSIASTSGGVNFDQMWIHNIGGGQPDVYSNRAAFSVNCVTAGTAPPGGLNKYNRTGMLIDPDDKARNPAAPFDITTSGDPKACSAHMANPLVAGLLCQPIAASGKLFILWSWQPHAACFSCPHTVDGFKVYQTDAGGTTKTYVTETSAGPGATVSVLNVPAGGFVGKCYGVSSYQGAKESSLGHPTCIGVAPHLGATTVTLQAANVRQSGKHHYKGTGLLSSLVVGDENTQSSTPGLIYVGYYYSSEKDVTGDTYYDDIHRAGMMFDLTGLVGRPLQRAVLHLHVAETTIGSTSAHPMATDNTKSCAAELGTGRDAWWTNADWIEADWVENPQRNGPDVAIDVTNSVRAWMNGAPNFGFVLRGPSEDLSAFTHDACLTRYDSASLTVEHF
jgi:hypothetical protein